MFELINDFLSFLIKKFITDFSRFFIAFSLLFLFNSYQKTTAGVRTSVQKVTPGFATIGTSIKGSLSSLR